MPTGKKKGERMREEREREKGRESKCFVSTEIHVLEECQNKQKLRLKDVNSFQIELDLYKRTLDVI
jgi:hypothetical protein